MHTTKNIPMQSVYNIKPGSDLYITDWLSRQNHSENKDREIQVMK